MANFNRKPVSWVRKDHGGGRDDRRSSGGRSYERSDRGGRSRAGRDENVEREMYSATCSDCGSRCEVPFKPTGGKPVRCNKCFKRDDFPREDRGRGRDDRGGREDRGRDRDDREMFSATCDDCGKRCEVPFKPSSNKPIYCDRCFGKEESFGRGDKYVDDNEFAKKARFEKVKTPENSNKKFDELSEKLDNVLILLQRLVSAKPVEEVVAPKKAAVKKVKTVVEEVMEAVAEKPKKVAVKKVVTKKVAAKKAPAKKK